MLSEEGVESEILVLLPVVQLEVFDLPVFQIFHQSFILLKSVGDLALGPQETYLAPLEMVVNEGDEVLRSSVRFDAHRAAYVGMHDLQYLRDAVIVFDERGSRHLGPHAGAACQLPLGRREFDAEHRLIPYSLQ